MIVRRLDTSILGKRPIDGEDRLHHFGQAWPWLVPPGRLEGGGVEGAGGGYVQDQDRAWREGGV